MFRREAYDERKTASGEKKPERTFGTDNYPVLEEITEMISGGAMDGFL